MKINISGVYGSGRTSVAKALAKRLNYDYISAGDLFRDLAKDMNISEGDLRVFASVEPKINITIDSAIQREGLFNEDIVIDSRIGHKFIPDTINIYLLCSRDIVIERCKPEDMSQEVFSNIIDEITEEEREQFLNQYQYDSKNYLDGSNLILNTSNKSVDDVVEEIIKYLKSINKLTKEKING